MHNGPILNLSNFGMIYARHGFEVKLKQLDLHICEVSQIYYLKCNIALSLCILMFQFVDLTDLILGQH